MDCVRVLNKQNPELVESLVVESEGQSFEFKLPASTYTVRQRNAHDHSGVAKLGARVRYDIPKTRFNELGVYHSKNSFYVFPITRPALSKSISRVHVIPPHVKHIDFLLFPKAHHMEVVLCLDS